AAERSPGPLPPRSLRWPAAAGGDRPRARPAPEADRAGRADLGPGRVGAGEDHRAAAPVAAGAAAHVLVHLARPEPGAQRGRVDCRDVPGEDRGAGAGRDAIHITEPPVHTGSAIGYSDGLR